MPDFYITGVSYDENKRISYVEVRLRLVNITSELIVEKPVLVLRKFIVDLLRTNKISFCTATYNKSAKEWTKGKNVSLYDDKYITTDPNDSTKDNLENLPKILANC